MINTQKGETMDNKESSVYRCESCNGIMEYDVETKQMKCPNCGNCVPILNDTSKIIEHKLTIDAKRPCVLPRRPPLRWNVPAAALL